MKEVSLKDLIQEIWDVDEIRLKNASKSQLKANVFEVLVMKPRHFKKRGKKEIQ